MIISALEQLTSKINNVKKMAQLLNEAEGGGGGDGWTEQPGGESLFD